MKTASKAWGRKTLGVLVLSMSSWILVGCGGGGSNAPTDATTAATEIALDAADYFSLQVGDRRIYSVQDSGSEFVDTHFEQVLNSAADDGLTGVTIENIYETEFQRGRSTYFAGVGPKGLIEKYPPPEGAIWLFNINAIRFLPNQFRIGDKFIPSISDGVDKSEFSEGTIVGIEAVMTPAGQFENCIKTITVWKYPQTDSFAGSREKYITWFAPGIGKVKQEAYNSDGVLLRKSSLIAYKVSGGRSEYVRPVATLFTAPSEATHGRFDVLSLQFSEPMWSGVLSQTVAVVTDPNGAEVQGSITFTENSWTFRPNYGELRVSGRYKVELTDVATDRAGNVVMPGSWYFDVDAAPPSAIATQFSGGKVFITFNEDLMPPEGFYGAYLVGAEGDTHPVDVRDVTFERNRVILDITANRYYLVGNRGYKVVIMAGNRNGLSDLAGNYTDYFIATIMLPSDFF